MQLRTRIIGCAVSTAIASGLAVTFAEPAAASSCWQGSRGKVCLNGFTKGDWNGRDSFMGVANGYNYGVKFTVRFTDGRVDRTCIGSGRTAWFDRSTASVSLSTVPGQGGLPWPC
ncbi:hypothetical protein [Embleya sp. NPDC001921]